MSPLIAIADDDDAYAVLLADILTDSGFATVWYPTGADLAALAVIDRPALIILDLHLERQDSGLAALRRLRAEPVTQMTPVLVCSADVVGLRALEATLRADGCELLEKPFEMAVLLARVRALVPAVPRDDAEA